MKITIYQPQYILELGQRSKQEDCIYPLEGEASISDYLFLVCDGMGGHEHGEIASRTVCECMSRYLKDNSSARDILQDETLLDALEYTYQKLDAKDSNCIRKMGTTLTLLYLHRGGCTVAYIGDSRVYHLRPSSHTLLYKSRDHSLVYDLYQAGEISFEEMRTPSLKNIITKAVMPGEENRVKPDIVHLTNIQADDYFYLCSDGMLEQMDDNDLIRIFSSICSDEKKCQQLLSLTANNKDNHSAYFIHIKSVENENIDLDRQLSNHESISDFNTLGIWDIKETKENRTSFNIMESLEKYYVLKYKMVFVIVTLILAIISLFACVLINNIIGEKKEDINKYRLEKDFLY